MDLLTLRRLTDKYQSDIDLFARMIKYKKYLQVTLSGIMNQDDKLKLMAGTGNENLVQKLVILMDNYQRGLDDSETTLYALTKSSAVILSELDMPHYKTLEGHLAFYKAYLAFNGQDDSKKLMAQMFVLSGN